MRIKIGNFECTEVWDGVFYKKLSRYPQVTDWEIRTIIEYIEYEKKYGRACTIECDNESTLQTILEGIQHPERYRSVARPKLLTECTACPYRKGCVTEYVCHTTSAENAIRILQCGKLLSAVRARKVPVAVLMQESRNAANGRTISNTSCLPGETAKPGIDWSWNAAWDAFPPRRISAPVLRRACGFISGTIHC